MPLSRQQICQSTSQKLAAAAPTLSSVKATIGIDGFVDEIIAVVDKRHSVDQYDPMKTIDVFGNKILRAAGQSSNYELIVKQQKLGGNGPIMANALAAHGLSVTYIGCLGYPTLHPVFAELAKRAKVISIAEPGHTDALEFSDGKLMLGKYESMNDVNWDNLIARVGRDKLKSLVQDAQLVGFVNWTMLPYLTDVWRKLLEEGILSSGGKRRMFMVDLCDPEKRKAEDIRDAMNLLTAMQEQVDIVLGLNLKESTTIAEVMGVEVPADAEIKGAEIPAGAEAAIEQLAVSIRKRLNLATVVVHPRRGAAAATANESGKFAGPFVQQPKISTGAGDHFNAGFCLGRVLGLGIEESLCTGVATSGYYVRTAESPSAKQLSEFIANLPAPE
ncbi:MAG TPA: PfkB family carbohydrate kinase [Humisphaera sp.]|nr:PfkB family carbohydrate kinase [Humisphaera sp.]